MRQHNPPSPGEILREVYLKPLKIKRHALAKRTGISPSVLEGLVNGQRKITVNVAWRLAKAFNTTPEYWLNLQQAHDIWATRGNEDLEIQPYGTNGPSSIDEDNVIYVLKDLGN